MLRTSVEQFLPDAGAAPGTYQEFLLRTSGPLLREPSAASRRSGRAVS